VLTATSGPTQVPVSTVVLILACPDVSSGSENWCTGEGGARGDCGLCVPGSSLVEAFKLVLQSPAFSLQSLLAWHCPYTSVAVEFKHYLHVTKLAAYQTSLVDWVQCHAS